MSTYRDWTTGSVYYSLLAMSELMGPSNTSRIVDLSVRNSLCRNFWGGKVLTTASTQNSTGQQWEAGNPYPAYAVYVGPTPYVLSRPLSFADHKATLFALIP